MQENLYRKLLKEYCDALISVQDKGNDKAFKGGIYCRSCKMIHGRCPDAVFGFTVMAKISGEEKYLQAAKDVFAYGENMLCTDGGLYNDAQAAWRYTTTFHQIAVIEALRAGKDLFDAETKAAFEKRAKGMAEWLYLNLDERSPANINYATTNGLALALSGTYFGDQKYLDRAAHLIAYAMAHISESGFLFGESKPHDRLSDKGCRSVDIGYNVEESIPALVKYAHEVGDTAILDKAQKIVEAHLKFLLPDGGWDNSFGNRNNKWTYWGSRTSDGCAPMFLLLADRNPAFAEAALRNTEQLAACTVDGFLYGGPHYHRNGEHACTHHLFEHVNSIAFAVEYIDEKYLSPKRVAIPADSEDVFDYYPEVRTYKLAKGKYSATVTDYDFDIYFSGHASGGTLTALYHKDKGAMIMGSVTDYVLVEPTNMQQALDRDHHRSLLPRFELVKDGVRYSSTFYLFADMQDEKTQNGYTVSASTGLTDNKYNVLDGVKPQVAYTLTEQGLTLAASGATGVKFILPLITGEVICAKGALEQTDKIFFLTGGFQATEYTFVPDENGEIELKIF
ncbi:MAG: alginate lyase family protein [Clostridia bacterium]|nr:alginate lyase family protein [Clostridia bacterium]